VDAATKLCMSKSGGATLKVILVALLGGPHEHAGPPPGTFGGPAGFPVRSTRSFPLLLCIPVCKTEVLNLPDILVLVANPRLLFCPLPCAVAMPSP
jgi:hypothetical protein